MIQLFSIALMISNVKPLHMPPVLDIQHVVLLELSFFVQTTGLANCYKALNLSLDLSLRGTVLLLVPKGNNNTLNPVTLMIPASVQLEACVSLVAQ